MIEFLGIVGGVCFAIGAYQYFFTTPPEDVYVVLFDRPPETWQDVENGSHLGVTTFALNNVTPVARKYNMEGMTVGYIFNNRKCVYYSPIGSGMVFKDGRESQCYRH